MGVQVVRCVIINNITLHLVLQVHDPAFELDLTHWVRTIGVEVIDSNLSGAQLMGESPQMLHDSVGYNAQCESWINFNATYFR